MMKTKPFQPNQELLDLLKSAYSCEHLEVCPQAVFDPSKGLVPRGFVGATGALDEVQAIFVLAEPGHPLKGESYPSSPHEATLEKALEHTYRCFKESENLLHRNVRKVISMIWPNKSFDEQLRNVWITEGRLCSIEKEIGSFRDRLCAPTHLQRQLDLMPQAAIIAFGRKPQQRLALCRRLEQRTVIDCRALAPPGCNRKDAAESWEKAASDVRRKFAL